MDETRWERRLAREKQRTQILERVIEDKTRELHLANEKLREHNSSLETTIAGRTADLRAALEAAQAASRAKSDFLAQMSHELRTPLHGLSGTIEALARTELNSEQRRLLDLSQKSASGLLRVIGDVLDFSRIECGKLEFEIRPTCIQDVVAQAASSFAAAAEQKGLTLRSEVTASDPTWVKADSHRIGQVLANLLSNAIKFTTRGELAIKVKAEQIDDQVRATWQVSDSGCGMSQDAAARIFEAFQQAEAATTRKFGGTGLGLSIVKGIVEAMGGEIDITSEEGMGTTFTFTTVNEACDPVRNRTNETDVAVDLADKTVLVVDDHPINRMLCETMLAEAGCKLLFATSGAEAIMQVAQSSPDIVLMDCHMPGMTGLEATKVIRATGYDAPILAVSADVTSDNANAVVAAGMQGILGKPFHQADLFSRMASLLAGESIIESPSRQANSNTIPIFSVDEAIVLVGGREEMVVRLCEVFLEELPASVELVLSAVRSGDAAAQHRNAHSLKGAASVISASRLSTLMAELESAGRKGTAMPEVAEQIEKVAKDTTEALAAYLASKATV